MSIFIYNTMSRKKEEFVPVTAGEVKMYVCGPTVYDFLHVGNFRGPIFFNVVRNWFEKNNFKVNFVYNYTDVDDNIIQRALKEGVSSKEISEKYILEFEKDYKSLGLKSHTHNPRVTEYIPQIIKIVEDIFRNGRAYEVEGEVFYSVDSDKEYGKLSGKPLEDLQAGIRVEVNSKKKNPLDFSLWKPAKPGEPHWSSPWGEGRPGWHIECSAMCGSLLGDHVDIHGGGIDLIFPHHENEIAQSEGASQKKPFVKYWMHNNFINLSGLKMSKSLGNIVTARNFLEKFNAEIFKFLILSSHYRTHSDLGEAQIHNTISALARIYSALFRAKQVIATYGAGAVNLSEANRSEENRKIFTQAREQMIEAMNDDFGTPEVMARLFELIRQFNALNKVGQKPSEQTAAFAKSLLEIFAEYGKIFSLFEQNPENYLKLLDDMLLKQKNISRDHVNELVQKRNQAKAQKDYAASDALRDQLVQMGIAVQDTPNGTVWEVQK